jgi:hypothetical protein
MIRTHRLQLMNSSKCLSGKPRNETGVSQYTALTYTALFCASGVDREYPQVEITFGTFSPN